MASGFRNHVAGFRAQYVNAQHAIGLCVGEHFDEAFRGSDRLGARIGGEGKFANLVGDARRLQFLFRLAHTRHFRRGVDDRWNGVVIHVARAARDVLDAGDRFVFRLVRQHRAFAAIADRPDAANIRL
jgi:hypothetical protein